MGCCGCNNKTSTLSGGIFGIIQSFVAIIMTSYALNTYFQGFDFTVSPLGPQYDLEKAQMNMCRTLLIFNLILQLVFLISSVTVIRCNSRDRIRGLRQWRVVTLIVIVTDVLFPSIFIGFTLQYVNELEDMTGNHDRYIRFSSDFYVVLFCFARGGLITWIANICFCVSVGRRVHEIRCPPYALLRSPNCVPVVAQSGQQMYCGATQPYQYQQQPPPYQQQPYQAQPYGEVSQAFGQTQLQFYTPAQDQKQHPQS